jgi:hypothetical protein
MAKHSTKNAARMNTYHTTCINRRIVKIGKSKYYRLEKKLKDLEQLKAKKKNNTEVKTYKLTIPPGQRDPCQVMKLLVCEIPSDIPELPKLISSINHILEGAVFTAPEAQGENWRKLGESLGVYLEKYSNMPWYERAKSIFAGRTI